MWFNLSAKKPKCEHCFHWSDAIRKRRCQTNGLEIEFQCKLIHCCKCQLKKDAYALYETGLFNE